MKPNEADKIIAEYMGWYRLHRQDRGGYVWNNNDGFESELKFSQSLDALVPVWEKLGKHVVVEVCRHKVKRYHWCYFRDLDNEMVDDIDESAHGTTIQAAACIATARCIQELNNE